MARNLSTEAIDKKLIDMEEVQAAFPNTVRGFLMFAQVCINTLIPGGPDLNRMQADICMWLFGGPKFRQVMAQRGQAKTTLTAIYAVFRLIHNPRCRILIFSAGGGMASEISNFVIQIINTLDFLEYMRADTANGDRASVKGYDVHWALRGAEKAPSIKCLGVDSNAQGSRADVIIADDIESLKNARTEMMRALLEDLTKEFESICQEGDIIYLGTPQTSNSIYNNLPARGYAVRIWTGRYPTKEEVEEYGNRLAPIILEDLEKDPELGTGGGLTGKSGKPTCPEMFHEDLLCEKELSMGEAKFKLQYMLNTALSDAERYPLKLASLCVTPYSSEKAPTIPIWAKSKDTRIDDLPRVITNEAGWYYRPMDQLGGFEFRPLERSVMFVDTAGGGRNGDETAWAIVKSLAGYLYVVDIGGIPGGFDEENLVKIVEAARDHNVGTVLIEKNFGNGAHATMLKPLFQEMQVPCTIEEIWESGQKELRIIDALEPIISTHRLIVSPEIIKKDWDICQKYPIESQKNYSLFYQMANITRDKDSLKHDDRLDALAGAVRYLVDALGIDPKKLIRARRAKEAVSMINNWSDPASRRKWMGVNPVSDFSIEGKPRRRNPVRRRKMMRR